MKMCITVDELYLETLLIRDAQSYQEFRGHLQIVGASGVTSSKYHTADPQFCSDLWARPSSGIFFSVRVK
jgi:hypothetical protein